MDTKLVKDLTSNRNFLVNFVREWNESRLDMFALSQPNEKMQFSGVMRFYFQESGQKATTKCIRVTSDQTVTDIMPTLIDKFCPDLKMLSMPNYELYEIHGTGDVRKISPKDCPLLVQLNWHTDDREGRFVLKNADVKIQPVKFFEVNQDEGQLKRRLSRREKKDLKKKRKEEVARNNKKNQDKLLADKVYRELPESSLTRTISNPEAVMRRRRQQKLEKRMKEFQNKGGPQTGGILKIFAESLKPEIPYKTILASVKDNADVITKSALEKFLLPNENPIYFCIVMAIIPPGDSNNPGAVKERIIRSSDCPLAIQNSWPRSKGVITFHLRRKDDAPENTSKIPKDDKKGKPQPSSSKPQPQPPHQQKAPSSRRPPPPLPPPSEEQLQQLDYDTMPYFLELTPEGKEISYKPKICHIRPHETVIGSSRNPTPGVQYLQLFSPKILASHCSIVNEDGCVSIVPHGPDADVRVSGKRIFDTTILSNGNVVQFGGLHTFRFCNPLDPAHSEKSSLASEHGMEPPYRPPNSPGMGSPPMSPISPELKEKILNEQIGSQVDDDLDADVAETTFGVDGGVETEKIPRHIYSARSAENLLDEESVVLRTEFRNSFKKHRQSAPDLLNSNFNEENLLPASLTFLENGKDAFFATVISEVNGAAVNFKLAPTYTLYLVARHVYSPAYKPGLNPIERSRVITSTAKRIATSVQQTIQENDCLAGGLAFWMANASELLHFYRQDMDLGPLTQSAQGILAQSIQESFALLVNAMEDELALALPAFLDPSEDVDIHEHDLDAILNDDVLERAESIELLNWNSDNDDRAFRMGPNGRPLSGEQWIRPAARIHQHGSPVMADVLYILSSAMSLLRRCRVNAALTIQLFSQLFHYINMWIFNRIVLEPELHLCTQLWGHRLRMRLNFVEAWAERQGLELAADCHLARIVQAAFLLESPKDSPDDVVEISQQCFKLNSLQLRCLLQNYRTDGDEPEIPQDLIETIVTVAESTADELTISDGREVKLEEDVQLQLPFLLPEEGYSSDIIRGVPPGLQEFLEPLCGTGLCELSLNPASMGLWTVYQEPYEIDENEDGNRDSQLVQEFPIERVTIDKGKSGLGLSICAAKGVQSDFPGIYIKAVIKGGLADQDGRLEGGDQILSVNESSLIDVTQTQAAKIMGKSGSVITLEVMKGAAFYHGLAKLVEDHPKSIGGHGRESSVDSGKPKMQKSSSRELLDQQPQYRHQAGPPEPALPRREEFHSRGSSYDSNSNAPPPVVQPKPHQRNESYDSHDGSYGRYNNPHEQAPPVHQRSKSSDSRDYRPNQAPPPVQQKPHQRNASYDSRDDRDYRDQEHHAAGPPPVQPKPKFQPPPPPPIEPEPEVHYNDSDYDSDGNVMTPDEKARRVRQQQRQREYEERLAKWEEERKRKEQDEIDAANAEADAKRREEEQRLAEEEAERQYEEEVRRRKAEEARIEEERRLEAEARMRQQEEEEKARLAAEEQEAQRRREQEEEQRRRDEESRKREQERRREDERRRQEKEEEEEKRRQEIERRRKEEQQRVAEEQEEIRRRHLEERKRAADEKRKREQEADEVDRRRRLEKARLIEERKRREAAEKEKEEERNRKHLQEQRENEERRRRDYEKRQAAEQQQQQEIERRRRQEEQQRQREYEARVNSRSITSNNNVTDNDEELDDDIAGINEAIREAEKIAAEMDLFMMEEEIKIEEGAKQKRQEEKSKWDSQVHVNKPAPASKPALSVKPNSYTRSSQQQQPSYNQHQQKSAPYKPYQKVNLVINNNDNQQPMRRSSSRENLLETNLDDINSAAYLPPPPEDLLDDEEDFKPMGNQETNIDSSDDEDFTSSSSSRATTTTPSMTSSSKVAMPKYDAKRHLKQNDFTSSYGSKISSRPAPPAVRPKSFKPPTVSNNTPAVNAVKGEFKVRAENDYERRRQTLDRDFNTRKNSSDDDAPPRPPPPKSVTPSPRTSMSPQFTYSNGHQDYSRSHSIGKRPDTSSNGASQQQSPQQEPMDFRTKMKMFNKFQQN